MKLKIIDTEHLVNENKEIDCDVLTIMINDKHYLLTEDDGKLSVFLNTGKMNIIVASASSVLLTKYTH